MNKLHGAVDKNYRRHGVQRLKGGFGYHTRSISITIHKGYMYFHTILQDVDTYFSTLKRIH